MRCCYYSATHPWYLHYVIVSPRLFLCHFLLTELNSSLLECRISKFGLNFAFERRDFGFLTASIDSRILATSYLLPPLLRCEFLKALSLMRLFMWTCSNIVGCSSVVSNTAKDTVSTRNKLRDGASHYLLVE